MKFEGKYGWVGIENSDLVYSLKSNLPGMGFTQKTSLKMVYGKVDYLPVQVASLLTVTNIHLSTKRGVKGDAVASIAFDRTLNGRRIECAVPIVQSEMGLAEQFVNSLNRSNDPEPTKNCPDCAEEVKLAAKKCRFCGHEFD
jgi:hypothetical protein